MNKSNKIQEADVQLEIREYYKPLQAPMVKTTQTKVNQITSRTRLKYGFLKPSAHLFRSSTRLQKSKNLFRSEDRSPQVVTAQLKKYPLLWKPIAQKQQSSINGYN